MPQEDMLVEEPKVNCLGKMVDIEKVKPNPENPKIHPQDQLEAMAGILRTNGWRQAIIVSVRSGMVVKGHGRLQTALFMKLKKVPVEFQDYVDEQSEYADMVADNRIGELGYVDALRLGTVLKKISAKGQEALGYSQEEINLCMAAEYVAPVATDRKFVVLETLKLTKEEKAIIGGAVQKFCLRVGKELEWGDVLAQICMAWQVVVLPTMAQAELPPPPPKKEEAPKPPKEKKAKAPKAAPAPGQATAQPAAGDGETSERQFRVKYVAGTTLGKLEVMVVRPEDSTDRFYTVDPAHVAMAKAAKDAKKDLSAALTRKEGVLWIESLEEA